MTCRSIFLGTAFILLIPLQKFIQATKNKEPVENWNPGIYPSIIYFLATINTIGAFFVAYRSPEFILMPDVQPPYSYVVLTGIGIGIVISLLAAFQLLPGMKKPDNPDDPL